MLVFFLILGASAVTLGKLKENIHLPLPITVDGKTLRTSVVIDANWRWLNGDSLEGSGSVDDMLKTYGVSTLGSSLTLRYVTKHQYGTNVGSRLYLLDESESKYYGFNLLGREFSFDVAFDLPCGLNSALYFSEMPADGGFSAAYGTGYHDAQCAHDIKVLAGGVLNTNNAGQCGYEMDIFEANMMANAFTIHNCKQPYSTCTSPTACGEGSNRYKGECDMDGADYNPYRAGNKDLYGPGKLVDTSKPFKVITQFIEASGVLVRIARFYEQNGKRIAGGELTDASIAAQKAKFGETSYTLGGLKAMGEAFKRGEMTLVMSLWDDDYAKMAWLDGVYPPGGSAPGNLRGPCPAGGSNAADLRNKVPNVKVTFSNIRVAAISAGTAPSPTPAKVWQCEKCLLK